MLSSTDIQRPLSVQARSIGLGEGVADDDDLLDVGAFDGPKALRRPKWVCFERHHRPPATRRTCR